jgi:methionyl-tRNA formyltransferase
VRLVFAGTPEAAIPSLVALSDAGHEIAAVLTRAPAAQGRSSRLVPSPVHAWAEERGIEVLAPPRARTPETIARLREIAPECCPVVAYGELLTQRLLDIPTHGWINLHFSLLPAHRGAAPVQRALMAGDTVTGATTFRIVRELDAGPVYRMVTTPIGTAETAGDLLSRLATIGAALLVDTVVAIESGEQPVPQNEAAGLSYAAKIEPEDVRITWTQSAEEIDRIVRGASPDPGAWTTLGGERFKILLARPEAGEAAPGELILSRRAVHVGTGSGLLALLTVQALGKKPMAAADWARGARLTPGERFE